MTDGHDYRDPHDVAVLVQALRRRTTRPWTLMEVCGGQTHAIVRFGLDNLWPAELTLIHGPGCPVCVTPIGYIDAALALAARPEVILGSFGDMLRVPGTRQDLLAARAMGADVRVLYSPLHALELARREPTRQVVFFAVGFETTAPASALAVRQAQLEGLRNFSLLVAHVRVPPALRAILAAPGNRVQGFLAAGHVCTVMGYHEYEPLARAARVPIVVTGFEPVDILQGVLACVGQLEDGRAEVENQYARCVRRVGNTTAQALLEEVFEVVPRDWRGLGVIAESGLGLRAAYADYDALQRFGWEPGQGLEHSACRSGAVLTGQLRPNECPAFGTGCTPEAPLGAPMVSSEGACAAYYRYRRPLPVDAEPA